MELNITIITQEEVDIRKNSKLDFLNRPFTITKENADIRKRRKKRINHILNFLIRHET